MTKKDLKIVFFGTPDFAVESLSRLVEGGYNVAAVVTMPDKPAGRGRQIQQSDVKRYAVEHDLPVLQPVSLKDETFIEDLRAFNAQLFIVIAFRMLPEAVWQMPPLGTFNLHASLLPRYRGAAPINWAVMHGDTETGVTTFMLNERIDEGSLLLQQSTPIAPDDTAGTLHDRLAAIGSRLVVQTIEGIEAGTLTPRPQPAGVGMPAAPKIFKPDCAVDWHLPGSRIADFVRGLSPYPAATMQLADPAGTPHQFKLFQVRFEPATDSPAGQLDTDGKTYAKIGVKGGFISILHLQISGKKAMHISDFLRGCNITGWKLIY